MALDKNKYAQTILYFCSKLGGEVRGKKKLAKLLYFADFDFFEKTQKSIPADMVCGQRFHHIFFMYRRPHRKL
jgi:hypothetical protein